MKIFLISNMYPTSKHLNFGVFVKNFERNFEDLGCEIVAKALIRGRGINLLQKIKKYFKFLCDILILGYTKKYDVIYVHFINHTAIPVLALKVLRWRTPLIVNSHGSDVFYDTFLARIISVFSRIMLKASEMVVCPSNYYKDIIHQKFKICSSKIFVSPSAGVNTDLFRPLDINKSTVFTIGYISRIDKDKGWDIFVRALHLLLGKYKLEFKAIMVGDGIYSEQLQTMIDELGLKDKIDWLGFRDQNDLPKIINSFDLFVFPSMRKAESLGLVGLEAMACGIPVIGSEIGGISGYLKHDYNGLLFQPGNHERIAFNILKYFNMSPEEKNVLKLNAKITAERYEEKKVITNLKDKIETLIN